MPKSKPYTVEAVKRYNAKFDRLTVYAPKGTRERIQAHTGESISEYINRLITEDFERAERLKRYF